MVSTLADVAEAAGVHPGTASKALNPESRHLVAAETVRRVLEIATKMNYQPNSMARGLRTKRSYTVGFMVPDLINPLFPPIVRGVEEVLGPAGLSALIVNTDNDPKREMQLFDTLVNRRCDGFICRTGAPFRGRRERVTSRCHAPPYFFLTREFMREVAARWATLSRAAIARSGARVVSVGA